MHKKMLFAFFAFCFLVPGFSLAVTSNISALVFTNSPVTTPPGTASDPLVVQTQNSTGSVEQVDETNDVTFVSSSPTGQFLNSSGNAVSTTMSKNTSSRTFYYKDIAVGTFTITVSIKGRTSGATFSASQDIVVGSTQSSGSSGDTSTTTSATSTQDTGNTNTSSNNISSHYDEENVSNYSKSWGFQAGAGRERVGATNVPIEFRAITESIPGNYSPSFSWSFGDGIVEYGEVVHHDYAFPGLYNVVLNISAGPYHAVSRTKVRVFEPDVKIVSAQMSQDGYVEIKNNSSYELNLGGWKVQFGDGSIATFAGDTIIDASASVRFPFSSSFPRGDKVALLHPSGNAVSSFDAGVRYIGSVDNSDLASGVVDSRMPSDTQEVVQENPPNTQNLRESGISDKEGIGEGQDTSLLASVKSGEEGSSFGRFLMNLPSSALDFFENLFSFSK